MCRNLILVIAKCEQSHKYNCKMRSSLLNTKWTNEVLGAWKNQVPEGFFRVSRHHWEIRRFFDDVKTYPVALQTPDESSPKSVFLEILGEMHDIISTLGLLSGWRTEFVIGMSKQGIKMAEKMVASLRPVINRMDELIDKYIGEANFYKSERERTRENSLEKKLRKNCKENIIKVEKEIEINRNIKKKLHHFLKTLHFLQFFFRLKPNPKKEILLL